MKLFHLLLLAVLILPARAAAKGPVKVFLLLGQSNMNGRGNIKVLDEKLVVDFPDRYPPSLMKMREDVWIYGANGFGISEQKSGFKLEPGFGQWKWFGPELGFGHVMGNHFEEQVMLVKSLRGGSALAEYWVSPSASKRTGRPIGSEFKKMLRNLEGAIQSLSKDYEDYDPEQGYQLMGVVWVHGNADGGKFAKEYEDNLTDLITDLRTCLALPDLPFIAVESLSSRPPGSAFQEAVDRVNKADKNKQAVSILAKSKIDLKGKDYLPYKGANDGTHWQHNPRAYLDVGYWSAEAMLPLLAPAANHADDKDLQTTWARYFKEYAEVELPSKK